MGQFAAFCTQNNVGKLSAEKCPKILTLSTVTAAYVVCCDKFKL